MSIDKDKRVTVELDDLPIDVFELTGSGLTVESLTAGHGMAQVGKGASPDQRFSFPCDLCCDLRSGAAHIDCDR